MHESALLAHVLDVVRAAPLRKDPFAHIYFENVLPEAFYAELLQALPDPSRFEPLYHKDALRPDGSTTRSTFTLAPEELAALPEASRRVLETCAAAIGSRELREALLARYEDVLRERFPTRYKDLALEGTVKLQRDEPGYKIGIHPDTSDKVVLLQLYLAPDDAHAEMGTALYRRQGQEFVKADTLAFRRNSGYSFARTEESWHGVEPVGALRYSLTLNYRLESQKLRRTFKKRVLRQLKRFVQMARGRAS
ncbi:MAG TPA: hypothetical protein VFY49_12460 [Myxococcota bacterium]|nr:hypothetical protein [Myxococcota bacterium]